MLSHEFQTIIFGEIKHAERQERRDQARPLGFTRKRFRREGSFEDIVVYEDLESTDSENADHQVARKLDLILKFIREHEKNDRRVEMIERCLLGGESPRDVAVEFGETESNASSIVSRARKYLHIRIRKAPVQPVKTRRHRSSRTSQLLSLEEAACELGIGIDSVLELCVAGKLNCFRVGYNREELRVTRRDLETCRRIMVLSEEPCDV